MATYKRPICKGAEVGGGAELGYWSVLEPLASMHSTLKEKTKQ